MVETEPLWLLREGSRYIVRLTVAAGHGNRPAGLPVHGATRLRIAVADDDEEPPLVVCPSLVLPFMS